MKAGGGKQKGGSFERLICIKLSEWVSDGKKDDLFWRSAMSGGRATVGAKKGVSRKSQSGDISAIAPEGHALTNSFSIECKTYADLILDGLLFDKKGGITSFWRQTLRDAINSEKMPMLIAKQNRSIILLGLSSPGVFFFDIQMGSKSKLAYYNRLDLHLYDFELFLKSVKMK